MSSLGMKEKMEALAKKSVSNSKKAKAKEAKAKTASPVNSTILFWCSISIVTLALLFNTDSIVYLQKQYNSYVDHQNYVKLQQRTIEMMSKKKPPPLPENILNLKSKIKTIVVNDIKNTTELTSLLAESEPVLIKMPDILKWPIFKWDLYKISQASSISLPIVRFQSIPTFVTGAERDRGGMLGSPRDRPLAYTNMTLNQFFETIFHTDLYAYYTDELDSFASQVKSRHANNPTGM